MICEVCRKNNADIVFKTVTGNQVATKAMCLPCAHAMQQDMVKMFLALGFRKDQVEDQLPAKEEHQPLPRAVCAQCGRPYQLLSDSTMAGCAACYEAMREDIKGFEPAPVAEKEQDIKVENQPQPAPALDALRQLHLRLMEAVVQEHFEEAAQLRDQIAAAQGAQNQS